MNMTSGNTELNQLLLDLIRIPSWVDYSNNPPTQNENQLVDFITSWLKKNTKVNIEKQKLPGGRFNIICKSGKPNVILLAHTDTVAPSAHAPIDQLKGIVKEDKIIGRGATDMKSGLAALLWAMKDNPAAENYWACLYADEEYFFLGMKNFAQKHSHLRPKYIISADGSDLALGNGCRGLIEFRLRLKGVTGHAAKGNGVNAIDGVFLLYSDLKKYLSRFKHPTMGRCSSNLAWLLGGAELNPNFSYEKGHLVKVGQAGNVIPDIAEFIVDIRPSSPRISAAGIIDRLKSIAAKNRCQLEVVNITHDLGAWFTNRKQIEPFEKIAAQATQKKAVIRDPKTGGYLDLQMIWSACGRPTAVMFGGGDGQTAHRPDEYISLDALNQTNRFFDLVLKKLTK